MSSTVLLMFSSKNFIVSCLTFRSLIHFEFIFMYGVRRCSNFILLHVAIQFFQLHLLKRLSFPHCIFLPLLSKIRCLQVHVFISGFSILFHWSVFLFLCQNHTVLITVALQYNLNSERLIPPLSSSFSRLLWLLGVFFYLHMNCKIFYSIFVKNAIDNLTGIALSLQIAFGGIVVLTLLILPIQIRKGVKLSQYHIR